MKKVHSRTWSLGKSLLTLSAAVSVPAMAQESEGVLEEVVVTAEFREATLQDTQISISAFNEEAIADRGISNALDLGQFAPNVNAQPYVGGKTGVSFNIRGIGNAETLISFDPAVSVYLDGVLISKNVGALLDVLELERIEILRGPQGTLYGRNTMGGAVNYITRKPVNEFEASLKANLGDYNQQDFRGMLNVPLLGSDGGGELNLRLSAASIQRDGLQDNVFVSAAQKELGTKDREVYMGQLQWVPTDSISVMYTYDLTRIDEVPEAPWVTNVNTLTATGRNLAPFTRSGKTIVLTPFSSTVLGIADTEVDGQSLDIRWDLSDSMTLQSLTGYREMSNFSAADSDGSPLTVLTTRDIQSNDALSQEFRLFGTAGRVDYSAGLFYMDEEGDVYQEQIVFGGSSGSHRRIQERGLGRIRTGYVCRDRSAGSHRGRPLHRGKP